MVIVGRLGPRPDRLVGSISRPTTAATVRELEDQNEVLMLDIPTAEILLGDRPTRIVARSTAVTAEEVVGAPIGPCEGEASPLAQT